MTLGELIDTRNITITTDDGDYITDIVIIAEVAKVDGSGNHIVISRDDNTNWLKEIGLVSTASHILLTGRSAGSGIDED